jgi:hypothetical protein
METIQAKLFKYRTIGIIAVLGLLGTYFLFLFTQPKNGLKAAFRISASEMRFINRTASEIKVNEAFAGIQVSQFEEMIIPADAISLYSGGDDDGVVHTLSGGALQVLPIPDNEYRILLLEASLEKLFIAEGCQFRIRKPEEVSASENTINIDLSGRASSGSIFFQDSLVFFGQFLTLKLPDAPGLGDYMGVEGKINMAEAKAYQIQFSSQDDQLALDLEPNGTDKQVFSEQLIFIDSILFKRTDGALTPPSSIIAGRIAFLDSRGEAFQEVDIDAREQLSIEGYDALQVNAMTVGADALNISFEGAIGQVFKGGDEQQLSLLNPSLFTWLWHNQPLALLLPLLSGILIIIALAMLKRPVVNIKKVLFLASNPSTTAKLQLEREFARISQQLQDNEHDIQLYAQWAVTTDALLDAILTYKPYILHFSGHGIGGSKPGASAGHTARDLIMLNAPGDDKEGIVLTDDKGQEKIISTKALGQLFGVITKKFPVQAVVLNACYSENQAKVLTQYVPYVIGMNNAISDQAAIAFSNGFYLGIAKENDVELGFDLAKNKILMEGFSGEDIPVLIKREG